MNIATVFPPMLVGGRPIDFSAIWTSPRGTTGSEIQILAMSRELAMRGHSVTLFIPAPNASEWDGVKVRDMAELGDASGFDAVLVSLDVNVLHYITPKAVRLCFQQVNDFRYGHPGFDEYVDVYVSPSEPHRKMFTDPSVRPEMAQLGGWLPLDKVEVVPNGCYPDTYMPHEPVPGKVVHISSPDRGLHLLLQEWPAIKKAVKYATLEIFYWSLEKWLSDWRGMPEPTAHGPLFVENWRRAKYVEKVLPALKNFGVKVTGSVSRTQMIYELSKAEALAYPCSVVAWTEGFSCATLEGCASGALPIISACDALGEIYGGACPMVPEPAQKHMSEWRALVIRALTDKAWADEWRAKARALAEKHAWPDLAAKVEGILERKRAEKV